MRYNHDILDVVVTCRHYADELLYYPQIRGYYLAKHLARLGLDAEFRQLPLPPSYRCRVAICSEYQAEMEWFQRHLLGPLTAIGADRLFCLAEYTLGERDHFSRPTLEWFAERGGVLCLGLEDQPAPFEHWIGLGVDTDVVPRPADVRTDVIFDPVGVPKADALDLVELRGIKRRLPGVRLVGTGPDDAEHRSAFDDWVPYGQPHASYVRGALRATFALVQLIVESGGMFLAEAQVSGACVVHRPHHTKGWVLCPEAGVLYRPETPGALVDALIEATHRDPHLIAAQARRAFDFVEVARRARAAIGL